MQIIKSLKSFLCMVLCVAFFNTTTQAVVPQHTQLISTLEMVESFDRQQAQTEVQNFVNDKEVKNLLLEYGLSETEISQRMASLSDSELSELNQEIQEARAGGILQTVLIILLIVFLVQRI